MPELFIWNSNQLKLDFLLRADSSIGLGETLLDPWRILQIIRLFPLFIGISQDFAPRYFQRSSLEKTRATTDPALACNATHGLNDTILVAPNHESRAHLF